MTPSEFKAWFEGFTEAFDRLPTKAQWARVKERVSEIDGKPTTERVFVDRYWTVYNQYAPSRYPYWYSALGLESNSTSGNAQAAANLSCQNAVSSYNQGSQQSFNSSAAMLDLGRADAKALS